MIWLTGGALVVSLVMITGLFALIFWEGFSTFWPAPVVQIKTHGGETHVGEVTRHQKYKPNLESVEIPDGRLPSLQERLEASGGWSDRRLVRTGNYDLTGEHYNWVSDFEIEEETYPEWVMLVERLSWGRFYGFPQSFLIEGEQTANTPQGVWEAYQTYQPGVRERRAEIRDLERNQLGKVNATIEHARLHAKQMELDYGPTSPEYQQAEQEYTAIQEWGNQEFSRLRAKIHELDEENRKYVMAFLTGSGERHTIPLANVVRAYPANQLSFMDQGSVYGSRWLEFLTAEPREANSEGGVYPAIFGTVAMTLIMVFAVAPFGVLAALYLREYAKTGPMISMIRIAINNLAGVPSIVYGVFGLGFFCYFIGVGIDELFFQAKLPSPTYGTGGLLWSSLTLALLTLPVVIVATEEALAAVPNSMRDGSYACGASKWQTIQRIVLPRALPGIMTGMILAMARGAGEVAPLMLVGAVKLAPELPVDGVFPYIHPERSFMHLGFHIYDLGFQSQNSEAAIPMVFTTTLLLILIIFTLNLLAIWLRKLLHRRFVASQF